MRNIQKLRDAHKASSHNKDLVKRSKICACFFCGTYYSSKEVDSWTSDETAICPYCFIDSVLPDASGIPLNRDFVAEMHRYWFGTYNLPIVKIGIPYFIYIFPIHNSNQWEFPIHVADQSTITRSFHSHSIYRLF
jgi:hypothetical protein